MIKNIFKSILRVFLGLIFGIAIFSGTGFVISIFQSQEMNRNEPQLTKKEMVEIENQSLELKKQIYELEEEIKELKQYKKEQEGKPLGS